MSTDAINRIDPERNPGPILVFLAVSVVVHLLFIWVLSSSSLVTSQREKRSEPIAVDVVELPKEQVKKFEPVKRPRDVVELPPAPVKKTDLAKPPTAYSDRTQSFEEEFIPPPEPTRKAAPATGASSASRRPVSGAPPAAVMAVPSNPAKPAETPGKQAGGEEGKGAAARGKPAVQAKTAEQEEVISLGKAVKDEAEKAGGAAGGTAGGESPAAGKAGGAASEAQEPRPNLLLTKDRAGALARKFESERDMGEPGSGGKTMNIYTPGIEHRVNMNAQINTVELENYRYFIHIKNKLELRYYYPQLAVQKGWQGKINVDFTIQRDGNLGVVRLVKSSGYPVLDDALITAIKLAGPFDELPADFKHDPLKISLHFEYQILHSAAAPAQGP